MIYVITGGQVYFRRIIEDVNKWKTDKLIADYEVSPWSICKKFLEISTFYL